MPSALLPPKEYRSHHSESATQTLFYLKEEMTATLGTHTETKDSHVRLFSLPVACHFLGASTKPSSWLYHSHCPGLRVTWALGHLFHVDIIYHPRSEGLFKPHVLILHSQSVPSLQVAVEVHRII